MVEFIRYLDCKWDFALQFGVLIETPHSNILKFQLKRSIER